MAPPSPLASPLRYRQVTRSPLLSPRSHSGRPRRRRSAGLFAHNHSWKASAPAAWKRASSSARPVAAAWPAALHANPWSVGGWIVLRTINSLVHWCCRCPGHGRAANPWWLAAAWVVWVQRFSSTSRLCDCPNSRGPAPHLRYRSQHSPLPVSVSNTFLGLCQPQDPLNWPACSH
jgi:hypothetical protein